MLPVLAALGLRHLTLPPYHVPLMKQLFFILTLCYSAPGLAQYWYNDVWNNTQTASTLSAYKKAAVTGVKVTAYDADNIRTSDVDVVQTFNAAAGTLVTQTASAANQPSWLTVQFNAQNKVTASVDSSAAGRNVTIYSYDAQGRLIGLHITATDSAGANPQTDEHLWQYAAEKPLRMLRIKNKRDTTVVQLKTDDAGRVIEETTVTKNRPSDPVYYYYDESGRLTDVVKFNRRARRLLPETMYEWGAAAQPLQRISVPPSGLDYFIWRYQYDQNGLKVREAVYNKRKQLTGKIEYQYSYAK